MENIVTLLIPILFAIPLLRLILLPMGLLVKCTLHAGCGFLCLWLLNSISGFTGILFPINAVTAFVAGFLGVPGIGIMALLEVMGQGYFCSI